MGKRLSTKLALRNLWSDRFGTLSAVLGVALGAATVSTVVVLDVNTRFVEARSWSTNPELDLELSHTVRLEGFLADGRPSVVLDAKKETHEDYQVMRSAIRLGSLSAYLVGALIVFFSLSVVVERRKRELALLRSLGALPRQLATIFLLEASAIGTIGGGLGVLLTPILSYAAAFAGLTTTGRARIAWLYFPWKAIFIIALVGAFSAVLGAVKPMMDVRRLDASTTLRPRFLEGGARAMRGSGLPLLTIPFVSLLYVLMRPFFRELLPSLAFFLLEAALVCLAFLLLVLLVPELVRRVGAWVVKLMPIRSPAAKLLTVRRVERMGDEMAWSVSGIMLVFSLLLALHLSTHALKAEVTGWAENAVRPYTFVYNPHQGALPMEILAALPEDAVRAGFSVRTPWPNSVLAVSKAELKALVAAAGQPKLVAVAEALVPGTTIVSTMMARRFGLSAGDFLQVGDRRLQVIAVTDELGYTPMIGPYRNSKTYALIENGDRDLIDRFVHRRPTAVAFIWPEAMSSADRKRLIKEWRSHRAVRVEVGEELAEARVVETDRDFAIFDLILFLTTLLAAVGVANNMILSLHGRRRETALLKVIGMSSTQLRRMFLFEGLFVGGLGGLLALVLGVPLGFAAISALVVVSAFDLSFSVPFVYLIVTWITAVGVALIASLYPAYRAERMSSAESIHYE
jgi:putative ABC transport system permease protein